MVWRFQLNQHPIAPRMELRGPIRVGLRHRCQTVAIDDRPTIPGLETVAPTR
jgi:hypothetical protein